MSTKPEIIVFAGLNDSSKDAITRLLIPRLVEVCDVCHIYDNTNLPVRIFKKRKDKVFFWESNEWSIEAIEKLTGCDFNE